MLISSIVSGTPYGAEYVVEAVGVGYTLLFSALLTIFLAYPFMLIASELAVIIPTNHGIIAYVYRGFYCISKSMGDIIGFINGLNVGVLYCVGGALQPLVFMNYLETFSGDLTYWQAYGVMLAVIICGFCIAVMNINIIGNTVNVIICACLIPIFIGCFIAIPDMNFNDSIVGKCSDISWAPFIASMGFYALGYEVTGNVMGEVSFEITKLPLLFGISLILSTIIYFLPIISVNTYYTNCDEWYSGLFAVAYGNIWNPLYYGIVLGSLFCTWAFYVISVVFTGRVFWAMSQKYILLNKNDGQMIIPSEYDLISNRLLNNHDHISYYDHIETKQDDDDDDAKQEQGINWEESQYTRIDIEILPPIFGNLWSRTGAPVLGIFVQSCIASIVCLIPNYYAWTEFLMFMYAFTFFAVIGAYLILKHKEPNLYRAYQVPFGKIGAWLCSISCLSIIVAIDIILAIYLWEMFLVYIAINTVFVIYYILWRKCGFSKKVNCRFCLKKKEKTDNMINDDDELLNQIDTIPLL